MVASAPGPARTLVDLLDERVRSDADRCAVKDHATVLTFRALGDRVDALARVLGSRGVKRHDVVVAAIPRSADLIVATFAALKLGATVLPLDLKSPDSRNQKLVEIAGARWSMVRGEAVPGCLSKTTIIDVAQPTIADGAAGGRPRPEHGDDAYIIFTSGSSGEPKGVRLTHGAMALRAVVEIGALSCTHDDSYLMRTRSSLIGFAVVLGLLAGGLCIVIASEEEGDQAEGVARIIEASGVTITGLPPKLLGEILALPGVSRMLSSLRAVRSAGESIAAETIARFHERLPGRLLIDGYGTTETGGVVTHAVLTPGEARSPANGSRPLPGVLLRIVGEDETEPGVPEGELWISTPMLSRGYLGGDERSNPKFVETTLAGDTERRRWYRTGDRARPTDDGGVAILGRLDIELNLDGVRADPVEIEDALRRHPTVVDAAVRTHVDALGRSRLVAYVVDRTVEGRASASALRVFLAGLLPQSHIPSRFIHLVALPLTPSRKVNRPALPAPESIRREPTRPNGETETLLLHYFREILAVPDLGTTDDFFEWGGDSFKAFALMSCLNKITGVRLPATTLLSASTVQALAAFCADAGQAPVRSTWIREGGDLSPIVCLPGMGGDPLWFYPLVDALDRRHPLMGLSFVGLKAPFTIDFAVGEGLSALKARQPSGPYFLLGHSLGGVLAFEMARRLQAEGERVAFVGLIDTHVPGVRHAISLPRRVLIARRLKRLRNRFFLRLQSAARETARWLGGPVDERIRISIPGLRDAARGHRVQPASLAVTLFRANEQLAFADLQGDWAKLARGGVTVVDIPGQHFNLIKDGRARELSQRISEAIALADEKV